MASARNLANLVALPHSVFALPFALASFLIAVRTGVTADLRFSLLQTLVLIVIAVVCARTAALAFNRLIDADIDAQNKRTQGREIPAGRVSVASAISLTIFSALGFLGASYLLGWHCFVLAPVVLLVLCGYSYTKRFTSLSHLVLGLALALAPGGAWWVVRPQIELTPLLIMGAVLCWVAGFDILYSCQDEEFDRAHSLFSVPALFGTDRALIVSRLLHLVAFALFVAVGFSASLATTYFSGMVLLGVLLYFQHELVTPDDLSRINQAFFTANGIISLGYLLLVLYS